MNGLTYGTTSVQYTSKATCWSAKWLTVPLHGAFRHGTLTGTLLQSSIVTLTAQEHSRAVFWKLRTCRACGESNMLCTRSSLLPLNSWAVSDYSNSCSTVVCVFAFFFFNIRWEALCREPMWLVLWQCNSMWKNSTSCSIYVHCWLKRQ